MGRRYPRGPVGPTGVSFPSLPYPQYFGGVSALTPDQYLKMNGFPNEYWGWGGEDDDIATRSASERHLPAPPGPGSCPLRPRLATALTHSPSLVGPPSLESFQSSPSGCALHASHCPTLLQSPAPVRWSTPGSQDGKGPTDSPVLLLVWAAASLLPMGWGSRHSESPEPVFQSLCRWHEANPFQSV